MLLRSLTIDKASFERGTGWSLKAEGACKGDVCIPLREPLAEEVDVQATADAMGLPLVAEPGHGLWALGPESVGGRALTTAEAPEMILPDVAGNEFRLSSLRGQKIVVYAWAPY
jgi:hypothetical protein